MARVAAQVLGLHRLHVLGLVDGVAAVRTAAAQHLAQLAGLDRGVEAAVRQEREAPGADEDVVPAGLGVDHQRERVDVRAFQLVQCAPVEHELRQLVRQR